MKFNIIEYYNKKTNTRYWYRVKFIYKDKRGNTLWDIATNKGVTSKKYITDHRILAKSIDIYGLSKRYNLKLCNGTLHTETTCYLGYFKSQSTN